MKDRRLQSTTWNQNVWFATAEGTARPPPNFVRFAPLGPGVPTEPGRVNFAKAVPTSKITEPTPTPTTTKTFACRVSKESLRARVLPLVLYAPLEAGVGQKRQRAKRAWLENT